MDSSPKLVNIATSKLSQDAFLRWLLSWADPRYSKRNPILHKVGVGFINSLYQKGNRQPPEIDSVSVKQPDHLADIVCKINEDYILLIDDKVGTYQSRDHLKKYKVRLIKEGYNPDKALLVYIQTGDQSDYRPVVEDGYTVYTRTDLLGVLNTPTAREARLTSDILQDFAVSLQRIEDEFQRFRTLPLGEWSTSAWKGFFQALQDEHLAGYWGFVPKRGGGFIAFWWAAVRHDFGLAYLQLEQDRLCFKVRVSDKSQQRDQIVLWHTRYKSAGEGHGIKIDKPRRFGPGDTITVAVLQDDYRQTRAGLINMEATVETLRRVQSLHEQVSNTKQVTGLV